MAPRTLVEGSLNVSSFGIHACATSVGYQIQHRHDIEPAHMEHVF
jgi:hypothetical protein